MNIYTIPVNFFVVAKTRDAAEKTAITFLNMACKEFAVENRIDSYEVLENKNES